MNAETDYSALVDKLTRDKIPEKIKTAVKGLLDQQKNGSVDLLADNLWTEATERSYAIRKTLLKAAGLTTENTKYPGERAKLVVSINEKATILAAPYEAITDAITNYEFKDNGSLDYVVGHIGE